MTNFSSKEIWVVSCVYPWGLERERHCPQGLRVQEEIHDRGTGGCHPWKHVFFMMHFLRDFWTSGMKFWRYNWWLSDPHVATIFWVFWTVPVWTFWDFLFLKQHGEGFGMKRWADIRGSGLKVNESMKYTVHLWSHICTQVAWSDASCNKSSAYIHLLAFVGTCNLKSCKQLVVIMYDQKHLEIMQTALDGG